MPTTTTARDAISATSRLYLARAVIALAWAGLLAVSLSSAGTLTADSDLPLLAVVLLILYPVLDVAASVLDARTQEAVGNLGDRRAQLVNAGISTITAVALIVAVIDGPATVLRVFGVWATLTGLIQLTLAIIRLRAGLPGQVAMIISGGLSTLIGLMFFAQAAREELMLTGVAGYAVGGAILYLVSTVRLRRAEANRA
ncbi:hypothetical protein [Kineosporia sp. NBRC 101731]|uniref:hypothetical protein n=1 Tax=Kineosporia sp. NBRC 101731 TaxID=3032199 RepID=UPI0024A04251|nr:hypothetical protein [Kineosporia sp. NBRC 101731]GLY29668.1 membrane protein [Kineosporia sp. NBRC 101731]